MNDEKNHFIKCEKCFERFSLDPREIYKCVGCVKEEKKCHEESWSVERLSHVQTPTRLIVFGPVG